MKEKEGFGICFVVFCHTTTSNVSLIKMCARKEAWTKLVAVIEKWLGTPREKGVLESIKVMLQEKTRRKQKVEEALQYKKIAAEAKRIKLE